jgi:hypothetical protein
MDWGKAKFECDSSSGFCAARAEDHMAARTFLRLAVAVLFVLYLMQLAIGEHPLEDQFPSGAFFHPLLTSPGPFLFFH